MIWEAVRQTSQPETNVSSIGNASSASYLPARQAKAHCGSIFGPPVTFAFVNTGRQGGRGRIAVLQGGRGVWGGEGGCVTRDPRTLYQKGIKQRPVSPSQMRRCVQSKARSVFSSLFLFYHLWVVAKLEEGGKIGPARSDAAGFISTGKRASGLLGSERKKAIEAVTPPYPPQNDGGKSPLI